MIGRTVSRYRIESKLGEGGMGSVWLAEDPFLDRKVALKFLSVALGESEEARQRFLREARAACALAHPGIATVYDAGEEEGDIFIAFQYIAGETVNDLVKRAPLDIDRALRLGRETAEALGHAHAKGILHRDVTSRNIMVDGSDRAIVVDFGLALPEGETRITRTGSTLGTMGYLAPEMARGAAGDRRSDLYSLAAVVYEMLTGSLPFNADRAEAVLYAVVHEPAEPPSRRRPELPESADHVLLRALSKNPDLRHDSMDALVADLERIERGEAVAKFDPARDTIPTAPVSTATALTAPAKTPIFSTRRVVVGVAVLVVIAVLARALGFLPWGSGPSSPQYSSVAVLPLVNQSDDPTQSELWAKGIGESIATKLSGLSGLRVSPWVSSESYSVSTASPRVICAELNVEALVVGTFRLSGEIIQATVALLDEEGEEVWTSRFLEPLSDVFRVQADIAIDVARELRGKLSGEEAENLQRAISESVDAYRLYLRGAAKLHEESFPSNVEATALFEQALELDPELAPAHVGVGAAYSDRYFFGWEGGAGYLSIAKERFRTALDLDPDNARALRGMVRVHWLRGRPLENLSLARDLRRSGDLTLEQLSVVAEAYCFGGLASESLPLLQRIIEADPMNVAAHWFLVVASAWAGRFEETIAAGENYFQRFGEDGEVHIWVAMSHQQRGDLDMARRHLERGFEISSQSRPQGFLAGFLLGQGEEERGRELARLLMRDFREAVAASPDQYFVRQSMVVILAALGERRTFLRESSDLLDETGDHAEVIAHCAIGSILLGDLERARDLLGRHLVLGYAQEHRLYLTRSMYRLGDLLDNPEYADFRREYVATVDRLRREYGAAAFAEN